MNLSAITAFPARRLIASGSLVCALLMLQGCIEAVIVGGAASGALVLSDRRQPDVMASDERIEIQISQRLGDQFKTAPLWGLAGRKFFLHDGRARTIEEAITLHGGEASLSKTRFVNLAPPEKEAVLDFPHHTQS